MPLIDDIIYLAAFMDGEGHLGLRWAKIQKGWIPQPGFALHSTDRPVLESLIEEFQVGHLRYTLNKSPLARKEQYKWQVNKIADILWLLRLIEPYLRIKRSVARLVIEELESYRKPRPQPGRSTVVQYQAPRVAFRRTSKI